MYGQNDLAGHGPALDGRGAETRKQDRFPGGFLHAETLAPQNFHVAHGPGFIQGKPQDHDPFLAQTSCFVRVSGQGHADNARAAGGSELHQTVPGAVAAAWSVAS